MSTDVGGIDVSRETIARLESFSALVLKWTAKINLIGTATKADIWHRHIVDSAQTYRFAPSHFDTWVDIGSGGGFPGVVVAILAAQHHPAAKFTFIESDQRKAIFLQTAARELSLSVQVIADRIEAAPPAHADVVSARALGSLVSLLPLVQRHLVPSGTAILHKGRQAEQEISLARREWVFDLTAHPSMTDPDARLLVMQRIFRAGEYVAK